MPKNTKGLELQVQHALEQNDVLRRELLLLFQKTEGDNYTLDHGQLQKLHWRLGENSTLLQKLFREIKDQEIRDTVLS